MNFAALLPFTKQEQSALFRVNTKMVLNAFCLNLDDF